MISFNQGKLFFMRESYLCKIKIERNGDVCIVQGLIDKVGEERAFKHLYGDQIAREGDPSSFEFHDQQKKHKRKKVG